MHQWLELCDQITRAGGRILVLDPPGGPATAEQASPLYAARIGAPFLNPADGQGPLFLRARGTADGDGAALDSDHDPVCAALRRAGLRVEVAEHRWQGQADILALPRNRFVLTYGPGSDEKSCEEVKRRLPMGAHVLCVETAAPSGQGALVLLTSKGGASVLLANRSGLRSHSPEEIVKFAGPQAEHYILSAEDVAAHVTESLCVRGTLCMPVGTSTILRGHLLRRGFQIALVDVSELFGKGGAAGGGPRALCNEWPGFVLSDDSPSYATRREELLALAERYEAAHKNH
jgi:hypothetical protein